MAIIYSNRQAASDACNAYLDAVRKASEQFGVSEDYCDPDAGVWVTAQYLDEKGEVKKYWH